MLIYFYRPVVIVIGMRGAGKTSQCKSAAKYFGMEFIDLDDKFEEKHGSIKEFVEKNNWEEFRKQEFHIFHSTLEQIKEYKNNNSTYKGFIVSCGGGIIESNSCQNLLKSQEIVIHFKRSIDEIINYLQIETERPNYGEEIKSVWDRRLPKYEECSSYEFLCPKKDNNTIWPIVSREFNSFIERILRGKYLYNNDEIIPAPLCRPIFVGDYPSYFICFTYPDISEISENEIRLVTEGASAIELRVDQLKSQDIDFVASQISILRCYSNLPIIFTVRTKSQGGTFEFNGK